MKTHKALALVKVIEKYILDDIDIPLYTYAYKYIYA
jgi:hypothetical protein